MGWILQKYGWKDSAGFERAMAGRKRILDAGTGLGRVAIEFCQTCKEGDVFAVDFSEAVRVAYENTRLYPNAHVVQADVMRLPFRERSFDFIFSEGVLHHTPDTRKAFAALLPFLAPGGEIAIYVYVKKGPIREFCDDFLRGSTTQLTEQECWEFSRRMTLLGKTLSELKVELEIPTDLPCLEVSAGRYDLQRFFYYHIFKCFWNDRFTFDENNLINLDWYHPFHAHRHTHDEVQAWFEEGGLTITHLDVSDSGITVRGRNLLSHGERRID